jgi:hypothetical protein
MAAFITNTAESSFRYTQGHDAGEALASSVEGDELGAWPVVDLDSLDARAGSFHARFISCGRSLIVGTDGVLPSMRLSILHHVCDRRRRPAKRQGHAMDYSTCSREVPAKAKSHSDAQPRRHLSEKAHMPQVVVSQHRTGDSDRVNFQSAVLCAAGSPSPILLH